MLSKAELDEIFGAIRDRQFRDFVRAMAETDYRPSEVSRVTAAEVDLALGVWRFAERKTAKRTQKPRVVYLTPAMVELTERLVAERPKGPLFVGPRGESALDRHRIRCRFRRLRAKLPHLKHFVAYNLRHTYATNALVNGVGVAQVAGWSATRAPSWCRACTRTWRRRWATCVRPPGRPSAEVSEGRRAGRRGCLLASAQEGVHRLSANQTLALPAAPDP